jgi:hypothetical protein
VVEKRTPCNTVEWEGLEQGKLPDVDISQRLADHVGRSITTKKSNSLRNATSDLCAFSTRISKGMDQCLGKFTKMSTTHSFPQWEQSSPLNHQTCFQVQLNGPPEKDHFPMDVDHRL